ncbi:MAG: tesA [Magnetococcales bacterium]|nr:tesA [Magnetococcales bacterium]
MKPNPTETILCLGDSLTEGFGVDDADCYPTLLQKRLLKHGSQRRVINAGLSGDTTQGVYRRMDRFLTPSPGLAVVAIGLNDGFMGVPAPAIYDNLDAIIQKLQRHPIQIILGGMRLPSDFPAPVQAEFASIYPKLSQKHNLHLIPFFLEGIFADHRYNQWDNIHPNAAGYRVVLENVWKIVQPLLPDLIE